MLIALGIIMFIGLILVHEFGHFIAAKKNGVEVEEFGLGFPPRIIGKRFKGDKTLYSINWLPLGGFVKLKGEHEADKSPGSYGAAPFSKKVLIILAGIGMNFVAAAIILIGLSWTGIPRLVEGQYTVNSDTEIVQHDVLVTYVEEGSVANISGINVGDKLISIANQEISDAEMLSSLTEEYAAQEVEIVYESDGNIVRSDIVLDAEYENDGYLGLDPGDYIIERSTWSGPIKGVALTGQFSWLTLKGAGETISQLVRGNGSEAAENVAGPVGIVVLLSDLSEAGLVFVLFFIALISITLGVMNSLPIPALDGGRLFVSGLFKIFKKPLDAKTEERIHATGMVVLLALIALITVVDVRRFL